jgi:A/G-specific adenine glycosylase
MARSNHEDELFEPYDGPTLTRLRRNLRNWYRKRARDLPWRKTGNPYYIWISEIMLQQTTVAAVVPYFERFLQKFPEVETLAAAEQGEVLRQWEGLGYYSRARNIHKAAGHIVTKLGGEFPRTTDELVALPGIGRYTAGAIVSFAYDQPAPIVEANTLRLYSRLLGYDGDPRSTAGQRLLWAFAESIVPTKKPGEFNQSLMELGSQVCTPKEPDCESCPLLTGCQAFAAGRQHDIPVAARKPEITPIVEFAIAIECGGRYLLRLNPEGQRWAGLWDFVRFPVDDVKALLPHSGLRPQRAIPAKLQRTLRTRLADEVGADVSELRFLKEIRHSVTRYRIRLQCLHAETDELPPLTDHLQVVDPAAFDNFPLSVTGRQLADLIITEQSSKRDSLF